MLSEFDLDLCRFYPDSTNLNLSIFASEMLQTTIVPHSAEVARAEQPLIATGWVGQKRLVRQFGLLPVFNCKVRTLDCDFADLVGPHFMPGFIEKNNLFVLDRIPDRYNGAGNRRFRGNKVLPVG